MGGWVVWWLVGWVGGWLSEWVVGWVGGLSKQTGGWVVGLSKRVSGCGGREGGAGGCVGGRAGLAGGRFGAAARQGATRKTPPARLAPPPIGPSHRQNPSVPPPFPHLLHPVQRADVVEGVHCGGQPAVEAEDLGRVGGRGE